jgi:hypothetical protein
MINDEPVTPYPDFESSARVVFEYNEYQSREANFRDWWMCNTDERACWGYEALPEDLARETFNQIWTRS